MTGEQLMELLKVRPGLQLEPIYNVYGEVERYYYDPLDPFKEVPDRDPELRPKAGEPFPEFIFRPEGEKEIGSKALKGSWVIITFYPPLQYMKETFWEDLYGQLDSLPLEVKSSTFALFSDDEPNLKEKFGKWEGEIKLVQNARNFFQIYNIIEHPTTFLLDPEGKVVKLFYNNEAIVLGKYIK